MSNPADVDGLADDAEATALDDARLVSAVLAGDSAAYDRLVRRYQRRALAVAYRLLGDVHDAADVAQDAFVRAFGHLQSLEDQRRFGPWLMRIVTNLSLNFRRSRGIQARRAVAFDELTDGPDELRSGSGQATAVQVSPPESSLAGELHEAVGRAVAALPEKQRLALILFSIEGLPQKEVAQILECSVELVKWNVFQARKTLRKKLAEYIQ